MLQQESILQDLVVIELASVLAGPAVGMSLAELGAQVIKIENKKTGGDVTRRWKVPGESAESEYSAYYQHVNYGKEVLLLDLKQADDRVIAEEWIQKGDIIISNYPEQKAHKMGMHLERLKQLNPRAIIAHLSAFGMENERPAFDVVLQAEAGFLYMSGQPDAAPAKMPVALIDILAAHQLKEGILLGLIHRMKTGKGVIVRTSLIEAAVASLANQATNWLVAGHIPQRMGSQHPNIAPYGDLFICQEEQLLVLAVGSEKQFQSLCKCLNATTLPEDERFQTNAARVKNREVLAQALRPLIKQWERSALLDTLSAAGVPAGAIRNMKEVFEIPEALRMVQEYYLPNGQKATCVKNNAFSLSEID